MKKIVKTAFVFMTIVTMVYLAMVFYAYAPSDSTDDSASPGTAYAAFEYRSGTPPSHVYTLEELRIVRVIEYENDDGSLSLHAVVGRDSPGDLQVSRPVFRYKEKLYQISQYWVTFDSSKSSPVRPILILIGAVLVPAGWIFTGIFVLKIRKLGGKRERERTAL